MKTYSFKLQAFDKNRRLHAKINVAGVIWNHLVRLQLRHRALFYPKGVKETQERYKELLEKIRENKKAKKYPGQSFSCYRVYNRLQKRRRKRTLDGLNAGAVQNLTERLQRAFKLFFTKLKRSDRNLKTVKTKNPLQYSSFTLKQNGCQRIPGRARNAAKSIAESSMRRRI